MKKIVLLLIIIIGMVRIGYSGESPEGCPAVCENPDDVKEVYEAGCQIDIGIETVGEFSEYGIIPADVCEIPTVHSPGTTVKDVYVDPETFKRGPYATETGEKLIGTNLGFQPQQVYLRVRTCEAKIYEVLTQNVGPKRDIRIPPHTGVILPAEMAQTQWRFQTQIKGKECGRVTYYVTYLVGYVERKYAVTATLRTVGVEEVWITVPEIPEK